MPSRTEYLNVYASSKSASLTRLRVSWNCDSVSPGKPTMMSVEKVIPGIARPQVGHHLEVALPGVPPQHPAQYGIGATLDREVHMLADRGGGLHGGDDSRREVGGIRAGESHPADPVHRADRSQQIREIVLAVVI